ncbi:F-box/LRR-repeat protein [Trifolium repens]|nr:F-box/LRR-repeat protein [Trifolium repens]
MASSSNVHHLPYIVLGSRGYLIDQSSFKFKRQRHNKDDMISDLPDFILHHILSFLPTKDAVKTSILATNWRYMWTYLSALDFQMISLLDLRYHRFTLGHRSPSLTQLSLQLAKTTLCIPTGIPFPSLKNLKLSYATFPNNNSLEEFLSRCPLLQDLTLNYCYLFYINKITIASSTLRKLIINIDRFCLNYHNFSNCLVDIDAVNLLSLTCTSRPAIQFRIVNPPTSILDSYIAFALNDSQRINQQHVSRCSLLLLSGLTNVKSLTLSKEFFRIPLYESEHLHLLPEFHNLTHLCLDLRIAFIKRKLILEFLLRCPKLEVLVISLGLTKLKFDYDNALNQVPPCFKSSLKILHIAKFDEYGIKFAKFLLKNARLLEEIRITFSSRLLSQLNKMADLKNQLVGMGSCTTTF